MVSFREARRQSKIPKKKKTQHEPKEEWEEDRTQSLLGEIYYKFSTETYGTQSVHSVKTNKQWYKGNSENSRIHGGKCISSVLWKIMEHDKHKLTKIRMEFRQSCKYFDNVKWSRKKP